MLLEMEKWKLQGFSTYLKSRSYYYYNYFMKSLLQTQQLYGPPISRRKAWNDSEANNTGSDSLSLSDCQPISVLKT